MFVNLVNVSRAACTVRGYAGVRFLDAGTVLPFQVRQTGNYLDGENAEPAREQRILPGAAVHVFLAKYRCDSGVSHVARSVRISSSGLDLATVALPPGLSDFAYCQPQPGTKQADDPGNVLQISAFLAGRGSGN